MYAFPPAKYMLLVKWLYVDTVVCLCVYCFLQCHLYQAAVIGIYIELCTDHLYIAVRCVNNERLLRVAGNL